VLNLRSITKAFPGTLALQGVSLSVAAGEVVALMGENGAGKSTLMKILSGVWPAGSFEGEIELEGVPLAFTDTRSAMASGISMIHQELAVFPELTVAEHLELDQLPAWIDWKKINSQVDAFLQGQGFELRADTRVGTLSIGGRQLVEIARALYRNARVLVFDEPTSALTESEVQLLYGWIRRLKQEGKAIIYITHRMDEVFELADRVSVLRDGRPAGEFRIKADTGAPQPRQEVEPRLISSMVGREIQDIYPARASVRNVEPILRVQDLSVVHPSGKTFVNQISFHVRPGEVLGLGGLLGAGRSETFEAIFGLYHSDSPRGSGYKISGQAWVDGKPFKMGTPRDALAAGLAFVSEDRKGNGLVLGHAIRENLVLPALASGHPTMSARPGWWAWLSRKSEENASMHWSRELKLRAAHLDQSVGELSGGNQQKVVLAKWLATSPKVLFLDEPTRGVDVGAKVEIYQWVQKLAEEGMAVVLASSEMPELIGLCHRVLVLREGHITAELEGSSMNQESIMKAASL
jgi:D-xylose transport system ATP-binding protein